MEKTIERFSANESIDKFILGNKYKKYKHVFITDKAVPYCDKENGLICSPVFPPVISKHADTIIRGKNEHEAGHARLTPGNKNTSWSPLKGNLINVLEDLRIERGLAMLSPVFEGDLKYLNDFFINKIQQSFIDGKNQSKPINEALIALHIEENGHFHRWNMSAEAKAYYNAVKSIFGDWKNADCNTEKGFAEIEKLADKILKIWQDLNNKDQQDNSSNGNGKNDKKQDKQEKQENSNSGDDNGDNAESDENMQDKQDNADNGKENGNSGDDNGENKDNAEDNTEDAENNADSDDDGDDDSDDDGDGDGDNAESGDDNGDNTESDKNMQDKQDMPENGNSSKENSNSEDDESESSSDGKNEGEHQDSAGNGGVNNDWQNNDFSNENLIDSEIEQEMEKIIEQGKETFGTYLPYTADDQYIHAKENIDGFEQAYNNIRGKIAILAGNLEQALKTQSRNRNLYNRETGNLNMKNLPTIAKSLSENIFYKKINGVSLDTTVSILIDESGSIGEMKYQFRSIAIAISEVLERLNIKFEILGHTTGYGCTLPADARYKFTRTAPILFFEHKRFNESYRKEKYRLGSIDSYGSNVDGEALMETFKRLKEQKSSRHIIIVLSDGEPSGCRSMEAGEKNLIKMVEYCRNNGAEVYAFGIGTKNPERYYGKENFIYINSINNLSGQFFRQFADIITKGKMTK